jgi:hypothetical protein
MQCLKELITLMRYLSSWVNCWARYMLGALISCTACWVQLISAPLAGWEKEALNNRHFAALVS